ncbi:2-methylcitrate dehydratase [Candidatus Marinamargulisbacteria bacterium SCGC AG-414-C22]|nr:2-methylcitrate dehydratase [Candidatus Marinamargulisbacteria bacterium SCGC AG-414-C22]
MKKIKVTVQQPNTILPKTKQLAWQLAAIAHNKHDLTTPVVDMIINRIIDSFAVSIAAINDDPVTTARAMALAHQIDGGSTLFGIDPAIKVSPEWAAWANSTALRQLDYHDTYLSADYSHPADNIPALLSVAQHCNCNGSELLKAIAVSYEIQMRLVDGICLHRHKVDHILHLGVSIVVGIGSLLHLSQQIIYEAIQQIVHTTVTTRQSRKGDISSWKAFAPAHAAKLAIEAIDRCMRGERSPNPIYEGVDSIINRILDGSNSSYTISLPRSTEPLQAILASYPKEHSAEYQSQAFIDLAIDIHNKIALDKIKHIKIYTSHHTHTVIGSGAQDLEKTDPHASRETLDHSLMYIFAVALEDGYWDYKISYPPARKITSETHRLMRIIETVEDPYWTNFYHHQNAQKKKFGGVVEILLTSNKIIRKKIDVAHAHPNGKKPFLRADYIKKFNYLTQELVSEHISTDFLSKISHLQFLESNQLACLSLACHSNYIKSNVKKGLF